jgi:hypothetical protein
VALSYPRFTWGWIKEEDIVVSLILLLIRLSIKLVVFAVCAIIWVLWALIALVMMLIAVARGNQHSARQWERSLRWRFGRII